ncbi:MAG: Fe-S cluster assembly protein SufD [Actinomycetota bacterium]|nr:Fe-S cluster assembly protein SufD [Actinomycetota bacterium]
MTTATAAGGPSRLEPQPNGHHPAWLTEARRAAFEWVAEHGFPTLKDEDWRYTRLGPILDIPFEPAAAGMGHRLSSSTIDELAADLGGTRLVFINGHFAPELSSLAELPEGATVTNLASVLAEEAERLEPFLSRPFGPHHHAFTALNAALAEDGAFVHLRAGTTVDEPIQLVFFSDAAAAPLVSSPRSLVLAGPGSQVTIVETYVGVPGEVYCTNAVTEVVLEEGAQVEHYKVQDESETAFHLALVDVRQGRGSRFSSHSVALGSSIARHEVRVGLEAEGAEVSLNGLYMPRGDQHHDNPILIEHAAPHCTSRQLYKGVVDGRGHGVFNGHIIVHPGAAGTDASQTNKNLLLSDHAEVDTRPRLEILADDVKCTHGATVGRLDEDAVFYLRSRGVPHLAARGLLICAFANEMVERLRPEPLRSRVEKLVAHRLATGDDEVRT